MVGTVFPTKFVVPAPPATPPRYSLLGIATAINDGARWQNGIEWLPEQQYQGGVLGLDCHGRTPDGLDEGDNPGMAYADPFVVYAEDHCSTLGMEARDFEARARRQLEAVQSARVAAELERGALAQADSLDNHWLTENPVDVGAPGAQSVIAALGDIEMGLAEMWGGQQCMIHVSPAILTALHNESVIQLSGQRWTTGMGHIVVCDAGYIGAPPDNEQSSKQWMYGTSLIQYRLSEVILVPGTLAEARAAATNRATNKITIFAERLALLQWDVGVVAAETDIAEYQHAS